MVAPVAAVDLGAQVQQPVDDAFKGGFKLKSSQLDPDDILELQRAMKRTQPRNALRKMGKTVGGWVNYNACADLARSDVSAIKHAGYWGRLYGGAIAVMLIDGQDVESPLDMKTIGKGQFKGFYVYDDKGQRTGRAWWRTSSPA